MVLETLLALVYLPFHYLPQIFMTVALLVIVPALFGREWGIRRAYVKLLMKLFDWTTRRIDREKDTKFVPSSAEKIIDAENPITALGSQKDMMEENYKFRLEDITFFIKSGIEAVIDDEVTKRFRAEELPSWNLMTRTNMRYHYISVRLSIMWFLGLILRYCFLFPLRVTMTVIGLLWMAVSMIPLSMMTDSSLKRRIVYFANIVAFRICCRAFSAVITYHDEQYMPKSSGICVANHTTTLDVCLLMQHRPYAVLGQIHGGFLGYFERTLSKCTNHVWFERSEVRERSFVVRRVKEHLDDPNNYPILLFPEGTCINNTSVMMFKKGTFEIPATIFPVAIKYNPWFGDAFWNSSKHSMLQYLAVVMTSWAIVADVWYLPAMEKLPDEDALHFAERVKSVIARKGGLVDCEFDGQLKRAMIKSSYMEQNRKIYSDILKRDKEAPSTSQEHDDQSESVFNGTPPFSIGGTEVKKSPPEDDEEEISKASEEIIPRKEENNSKSS
ncbi:glycerol-3-phosphate acyltransferase 3-like [Styela clava]